MKVKKEKEEEEVEEVEEKKKTEDVEDSSGNRTCQEVERAGMVRLEVDNTAREEKKRRLRKREPIERERKNVMKIQNSVRRRRERKREGERELTPHTITHHEVNSSQV